MHRYIKIYLKIFGDLNSIKNSIKCTVQTAVYFQPPGEVTSGVPQEEKLTPVSRTRRRGELTVCSYDLAKT